MKPDPARQNGQAGSDTRPEKILFVDDELNVLIACQHILRRRYEIATAQSVWRKVPPCWSMGFFARTAHTSMGAELSFSTEILVRQPPATDRSGTGDRVPGHLGPFDAKKTGFSRKTAQTGAVTLIQRFGGAPNPNVRFHGAHPCAPPCGRPAVVQIDYPADLSHAVSGGCLHHHALG